MSSAVPKRSKRNGGALGVAEEGLYLNEGAEEHPSGAEARFDFAAFSARLKPCPDTEPSGFVRGLSSSAACLAPEGKPFHPAHRLSASPLTIVTVRAEDR